MRLLPHGWVKRVPAWTPMGLGTLDVPNSWDQKVIFYNRYKKMEIGRTVLKNNSGGSLSSFGPLHPLHRTLRGTCLYIFSFLFNVCAYLDPPCFRRTSSSGFNSTQLDSIRLNWKISLPMFGHHGMPSHFGSRTAILAQAKFGSRSSPWLQPV